MDGITGMAMALCSQGFIKVNHTKNYILIFTLVPCRDTIFRIPDSNRLNNSAISLTIRLLQK